MIQDSGSRREFETGAVRDIAEGKGRCDLLPLDIISNVFKKSAEYPVSDILTYINEYINAGNEKVLEEVVHVFSITYFSDPCTAILELAKHFEDGVSKYGERNWQKGIPLHCYIDSAVRHYLKFLRGDKDERHDRAFLWNILCCLWTQKNKPEMIDLPFAEK